jgi:N-acetylated-alpha-linked acidic dipeptidase
MLEVVAVLGRLRSQGWRPLRSIIFASWDAEEYNMIGSTEWVEDHIDQLRSSGVAYLNVDVGVTGSEFRASASPLFKRPLLRVLGRVTDQAKNKTMRQLWDDGKSQLGGLGSGSDYVAFQDLAGVSSIDFGFGGGGGFPYHSCYETYEWMSKFGDPGFHYHKSLAEIWVLLLLEMSQELVIPFSLVDYANAMAGYVDELHSYSETSGAPMSDGDGKDGFDLSPLYDSVRALKQAGHKLDEWENYWFGQVFGSGGMETNALAFERMSHNGKLADFETNLLDIKRPGNDEGPYGVPGREQFKHVVFGPQLWSGYDEAYFPFIRDAIEKRDWVEAQRMVRKTARIVAAASKKVQAR